MLKKLEPDEPVNANQRAFTLGGPMGMLVSCTRFEPALFHVMGGEGAVNESVSVSK